MPPLDKTPSTKCVSNCGYRGRGHKVGSSWLTSREPGIGHPAKSQSCIRHTALAFRIGHALVAQSLFASYRTCSIAVAVAIAAPTSLGAAARSKLMESCFYRKKQIGVLATTRRECPNVDCHIRREWQRCLLVERDGTVPALDVNRCTRRTSQRTGHGDPDGVWATGAACSQQITRLEPRTH